METKTSSEQNVCLFPLRVSVGDRQKKQDAVGCMDLVPKVSKTNRENERRKSWPQRLSCQGAGEDL